MKRFVVLLLHLIMLLSPLMAQQGVNSGELWYRTLDYKHYINKNGEYLKLPVGSKSVRDFINGYAEIRLGRSKAIIDTNGNIVLEFDKLGVDDIAGYDGNIFMAEKEGKWGFLNRKGEWTVAPKFDNRPNGFYKDRSTAVLNGERIIIDREGNIIAKIDEELLFRYFYEDRALTHDKSSTNGGNGYVDLSGKLVIPAIYFKANHFSEGVALVQQEKRGPWFFIDINGKKVGKLGEAEFFSSFSDGLAVIQKNNMIGYINHDGKIVIPCQYVFGGDFIDGYAAVSKDRQMKEFGIIDKNGKLVVDFICKSKPSIEEGGAAYVYLTDQNGKGYSALIDLDKGGLIIQDDKKQ